MFGLRSGTLPRGPIDTQVCVAEFCPLHIEEKRAISEKACVPNCVPQKQGTFQNCARVAENCARIAKKLRPTCGSMLRSAVSKRSVRWLQPSLQAGCPQIACTTRVTRVHEAPSRDFASLHIACFICSRRACYGSSSKQRFHGERNRTSNPSIFLLQNRPHFRSQGCCMAVQSAL